MHNKHHANIRKLQIFRLADSIQSKAAFKCMVPGSVSDPTSKVGQVKNVLFT
jgi:hypothetical protein